MIYLAILRKRCTFAPLFARASGCSAVRLARLLWEQEVPGSNPGTPTKQQQHTDNHEDNLRLPAFFYDNGMGINADKFSDKTTTAY